jgi:hypothetical protein
MTANRTYTLARGGQRYGPYTLEQLRDYVNQGSVQPTDLVWCEGMTAWSPVSTVLGTTPNAGSVSSVVPPPIPGYSQSSPVSTPQMGAAYPATALPTPPAMHWALVLIIAIVTCGIFGYVWMFLQAAWIRRIEPSNNALIVLAIALPVDFLLYIASFAADDGTGLRFLAFLVGFVGSLVAYFSMREVMQNRFALRLSAIMTFFFTVLYLQYHMSRIASGEVRPV